MAKNKTSYNIDVNLLARAQADFKNIESALAGLGTKAKGIVFDDKSSKKMASTIERITQTIPDLQAKLASGLFSDREIKEFSAGVKSLTKDVDGLANQFRTIDLKKLGFDDGLLKTANDNIKNIKASMTQLQSDLRLDTSGILGNQEFVKKLSGAILSASKDGDSLVNKLADIRTEYQQVADEQDNQAKQFQQKIVDTSGLETQLEVYKRLKQELEQSKKKSVNQYSPELTAALGEAKKIDDTYKGVRSHQDKIEATTRRIAEVETQLTAEKEKQGRQMDDAVKLQKKAQDAAQRVADIDMFAAKNTTQFAQFDAQMSQLSKDLELNEQQAESLRTALMSAAQVVFAELVKEIQGAGTATKITTEQIKEGAKQQEEESKATDAATESFKNKITQIFGLYNIYQLIRRGIQDAYQSIKQLDTAMNEIAVVTSMTTNELWGQIDTYMAVAKQYGVATQGVYEVSKLYYQQGRQAAEVTLLTAETLKMAKIAGLDYSKATDNMTVALNGFKMSAQDASTIVDVYSKLAAVAAVDTEELAYAMSKTASIAESAGMSFENTSVFLTQMIETTREAPENIGTALKTIVARFQEMKKSPMDIIDVEGEEVSFNKVDQALKTIGTSLQDASGQFRDLDGVIYELADKWDSLDRNTQRYIATTVAGSRQQSRFLALMQDNERLQELRVKATESEDAGLIQYSKTLDSLDSKLKQLATSFQELYMGIINGPVVKAFVDGIRFIIDNLNSLPKVISITLLPAIFILIKKLLTTIGTQLIAGTRTGLQNLRAEWSNTFRALIAESKTTGAIIQGNLANGGKSSGLKGKSKTDFGQLEQSASSGVQSFASKQTVFLGKIYLIIAAISAVVAVVEMLTESTQEKVARLKDTAEKANIARATAKDELTSLTQLKKKYDELHKIQNKTQEQTEEYNAIRTEIADKYPELIQYIDSEGIAVLNMAEAYDVLAQKKKQAYDLAFVKNAQAQLALASDIFVAASETGFKRVSGFAQFWARKGGTNGEVAAAFEQAMKSPEVLVGNMSARDKAAEILKKNNNLNVSPEGVVSQTIHERNNILRPNPYEEILSEPTEAFHVLTLAAQETQAALEVAKKTFIAGKVNFELQEAGVSSNLANARLSRRGAQLYTTLQNQRPQNMSQEEFTSWFNLKLGELIKDAIENIYTEEVLDSEAYKNADEAISTQNTISQKRFEELMAVNGAEEYLSKDYNTVQENINKRYQAQEERYATMLKERWPEEPTIFRGEDRGPFEQDVTIYPGLTSDLYQKFKEFQEKTSDAAADYLISMTDSALAILSSDSKEKTIVERTAQQVADDSLAFMNAIYGASIDDSAEAIGKVETVLKNQDANSVTGLFYLIDALKQIEGLNVADLEAAKDLRLKDLVLTTGEKTAAFANYISAMEEFNKIDLKDVSMTDALKYIDSEQYNLSWDDFEITESGKIQFRNIEKAQSEILGVSQELFDYLSAEYPEWVDTYENWVDSWKQQTDREKLQSQLGELDFSDAYNDLSVEQADYLNTLLGGKLSFQDVLGGKRLSSANYRGLIEQLTSVALDMEAGPELTAILETINSLKQAINDSVQDYVDSIIGALDPEKNQAVLSKEELKWLGIDTSNLESAGIGKYIVEDANSIIEQIRTKLKSEGYSEKEIAAEIAKYTEERENFLKDEAKALSDALLSMLDANAEELVSQANANQFKDENLAKALAGLMGQKSVIETDEGFSIDGAKQDDNIKQVEDYFASRGKNLYDTMTLVAETEGQLDNIAELQKELTDVRLNNGQREIALARQLASIIHSTILDAESYNFMGNSKTNQELAPMYALMQSTQTAVAALQEASKSGKISTESLNAMLDFVGRDKKQFKALDKISRQLKPPLETEMSAEDAAMMEEAIKEKSAEKVKEYNDYVQGLNAYIDKLESTQDDSQLLSQYSYMGKPITSFNEILPALEVQIPAAEMQKLLGIGSLTGGKDMASFLAQLASAGIIEKTPDLNAPSPVKEATEAQQNLQAAIETAEVDLDIKVEDAATAMTDSSSKITEAGDQIKTQSNNVATAMTISSSKITKAGGIINTQFGGVATAAETLSNRLSSIKLVVGGSTEETSTPSKSSTPPADRLGYIRARDSAFVAGGLTTKSEDALVGEFGPEIAVSDGKYYVVGKNGPERVTLPQGSFILNHKETAKVLGKSTRALGDSFALSDYKLNPVSVTFGGVVGAKGGGSRGGSHDDSSVGGEDEPSKADFDRWYNYLRLIEDVEQALTLLQAARENLSGAAYTQSQVNEIALLQQKAWQVNRLRDAQKEYLSTVNANKIKEYGDVLSVVNGVLQIHWDKLQGMDQDAAEPIQNIISEWEELNSSIHDSNVQLENFKKQIKDLENAMRDTYLDVENQIIEAIKYRQQMIVKNLQDELTMKQKYDNKYLESLRKNIEKERKLRDRSDSEADRVALQRKLALLKRDTSGKSDSAIAETERELREANRQAYDQRQDDYIQAEEDAALAAQEALQLQIEIQTEILTMMSENVQLIQETVDALLQSGPINLANFLANWNASYLNSTPIQQQKFMEDTLSQAGKATAYLKFVADNIKPDVQPTNVGTWKPTTANGTGTGSAKTTQAPAAQQAPAPASPTSYVGRYYSSITKLTYSATSTVSQRDADQKAKKKGQDAEAAFNKKNAGGGGGGGGGGNVGATNVMLKYSKGGLVDYTGPALVHGSKQKPEAVLNPTQTGIFQNFVALLDQNFGKNIQGNMVRPNSFSGAPESVTVIVENITVESGVISRDYDARRAGDLVKEQILDIAKYKGNMTLKR